MSITELERSYALETEETNDAENINLEGTDTLVESVPIGEEEPSTEETLELHVEDIGEKDTDDGIMSVATDPHPGLSLTIDGGDGPISDTNIGAVAGTTSYTSRHKVAVKGQDVTDYHVYLGYNSGADGLKRVADGTSSDTTALGGAAGKTGANLTPDTWGYYFGTDSSTAVADLTYQSMGTNIPVKDQDVSYDTVNDTYDLVFAAKFSDDALPGKYSTQVLLSLTSTPRQVSAGMETKTYMQDVDGDVCKATPDGWSGSLIDNRGTSPITYTVRKHEDGNCWMTQNLRLPGRTQITSANSDVSSNYTLPASSTSGFSDNAVAYMYNGTSNATDYTKDYGAFYSWCAATAGTCSGVTTGNDAPSSICPKGWKLPPKSGKGSYAELATAIDAGNDAAGGTKFRNSTYKFNYAGDYNNSSRNGDGSYGYYWSRTASSNTDAYILFLFSSAANSSNGNTRRIGSSVRCVAVSS